MATFTAPATGPGFVVVDIPPVTMEQAATVGVGGSRANKMGFRVGADLRGQH